MESDPLPRRIAWFAPWTWKRRRIVATVVLLLLLVAYPLSMGPAFGLLDHGLLPRKVFQFAYRPVTIWCHYSTAYSDFLSWYITLFEKRPIPRSAIKAVAREQTVEDFDSRPIP